VLLEIRDTGGFYIVRSSPLATLLVEGAVNYEYPYDTNAISAQIKQFIVGWDGNGFISVDSELTLYVEGSSLEFYAKALLNIRLLASHITGNQEDPPLVPRWTRFF